jgi:hypothetical protein|tara:strand:+ start:1730 stop:1954 length:225 start_codon:yes stop_codon:yes gene_type:complete
MENFILFIYHKDKFYYDEMDKEGNYISSLYHQRKENIKSLIYLTGEDPYIIRDKLKVNHRLEAKIFSDMVNLRT